MSELKYFAANIKYLRQKNNIKQDDVANLFNVTGQAVSKWETAKSLPSIETLLRIADYFQISMEDLISTSLSATDGQDNEEKMEVPANPLTYSQPQRISEKSRATKSFFILNIILAILNILTIILLFVPLDQISLVIVIIAVIANLATASTYIQAAVKINRHSLIKNHIYKRFIVVSAPINLASAMWFLSVGFILDDLSQAKKEMAYYLVFFAIFLVIGLLACISNVLCHKVEEEIK